MQQVRLIDLVFPGDTNHHGTLFGGLGLAFMDKVAFISATQYGRVKFVTASVERIDFRAPANVGEIVEFTGKVIRVGRRSLSVEVTMMAEILLTGQQRLCTQGVFNMVAVDVPNNYQLPPLPELQEQIPQDEVRMVEMVFPNRTSHYGNLLGGQALAAMTKAAFITATRLKRQNFVLGSTHEVDFQKQIPSGAIMDLSSKIIDVTDRATTVRVTLSAENLFTGERYIAGKGNFVMIATRATPHP